MAAQHEGGDVLDRDVEFVGEEIAEAWGIQHPRHAHHLLVRHAGSLLQRPHHGVERVGDADDEGVGGVFLDAGADLLHHLEIDAQEIVATHARLARHARGDDADLGAVERLVWVGASEMRVEPIDRWRLRDIERFTLRHALGDVEHHDVAQFLQADEVGQRSADLAGANQSNFVARHGKSVLWTYGGRWKQVWLAGYPFRPTRSSRGVLNCQSCVRRALISIRQSIRHSGARALCERTRNPEIPGLVLRTIPQWRLRLHQPRARTAGLGILASVGQRQIGFRAHLDQPRGRSVEFARLIALARDI